MQQRLAQNQLDFLRPMIVKAFSLFGFPIDTKPTLKMVKKRYRELAKEHHPDKGGNEKTMKEIVATYELLIGKSKIRIPPPQQVEWRFVYAYAGTASADTTTSNIDWY